MIQLETTELKAVESSKAAMIRNTFEPMAEMLEGFESDYTKLMEDSLKGIDDEIIKRAKRLRIDIGKVRIETEKTRKSQKEEYLKAGKAIDGVANILKWAVSDKETKLKEVEDHFEIQEQKRLQELQDARVKELSAYVDDAEERRLSDMEEDVWNAFIATKKKDYYDRIEAEKQAEIERIAREKAEKEEREKIRKENEKLREEVEKREKAEAERLKLEATAKKEQEAKERKEKAAYEAKLRAEREERERIQRELEAKEEAERKAKVEEETRLQAELSKGDADKVKDLIADLSKLKSKYSFKSKKNQKIYSDVGLLLDKIINHIKK